MSEAQELADKTKLFMKGTRKLSEQSTDMWFFELFHHLDDCLAFFQRSPLGTSPEHGIDRISQKW